MMLALAACQREPQAPVNPTYNADENTVIANLILNVSSASGSETKQTATAVQAGGLNFRGMQDVHLLTYHINEVGPEGQPFLYKVGSYKATKDFDLGDMMLEGDASTTSGLRVLQLALPLETNTVLVYGRATRTGKDTDEKLGHVDAEGVATTQSLDNLTFSLKNRMNGKSDDFALFGDLMGRILTGIMNTGLEVQTAARGYKVDPTAVPVDGRYHFWWPDDAVGKELSQKDGEGNYLPDGTPHVDESTGIEYVFHIGSKTWRQFGDDYGEGKKMSALAEVMGEAYHNIMTIQSKDTDPDPEVDAIITELRSASSGSVLRLTEDLFGILSRAAVAIPMSAEEKIAQMMAEEVIDRASKFYVAEKTTDNSGETPVETYTGKIYYQPFTTIMAGVDALIPERSSNTYTSGTADLGRGVVLNAIIDDSFFYRESKDPVVAGGKAQVGFPQNLGLPLGAALMKFVNPHDDNPQAPDYNVVTYLTEVPAYGVGGGSFPITNYRYPAELMYYTNSNIRTSDALKTNRDFPTATNLWWSATYWTGWTGGNTIQSTTQSVGVAKTINYGTALLAVKVGYSAPTIYDNMKYIPGHSAQENNSFKVNENSNLFEVTGIMIGGVCDEVGWDFLPKNTEFNKMIYDDLSYDGDSETPGAVAIPRYTESATDRYTKDLYTLTFDNYDKSKASDKQAKVYIALELKNKTGQDLGGELNIIRKDGTFYLVGELDPTAEAAVAKFKDASGKINLSRNDFNYPPFDDNGNTIHAPRIFMQDYVTTVKMNFTPTSLASAYVTMPDLRAGQVSLGLSVDVKWESGYEFDINLGGGTNTTN